MNVYPLAIYTANHGLAWNYPEEEISFTELDACRKAFGRLPDFGSGEKGFDGVWAKGDRVFAMRCRSVDAWDFRGRSATYLAVTWIPRRDAAATDFGKLLNSDAMAIPSKTPPAFFNAEASVTVPVRAAPPFGPGLPDGFARAGAIIAASPASSTVAIKRIAGHVQASLAIVRDAGRAAPVPRSSAFRTSQKNPPPPAQSPALIVLLAICFLAMAAAGIMWFKWRAAEDRIAELETRTRELQEKLEASCGPRRLMPHHDFGHSFPFLDLFYFTVR